MGIIRNTQGPLINATIRRLNDTTFWEGTRPPEIEPADSDRAHTIRIADRLDNLAFGYLGDPNLGWVILLRNDLRLVPNDLVPGRKLFIPTRSSLLSRGVIR